jgi:hypothetical protein
LEEQEMKELTCLQGTLGFDDHTYHRGDQFEAPDEMADHLIKHGLVRVVIPTPEPTPEPISVDEPEPEAESETGLSTAAMVNLETLNTQDVKKIIEDTDDREVLEAFHEQEESGKNRKTVTDAIITKINSL